jgi:hypothetical protein
VVPPMGFKRASRDAAAARISTPLTLAALFKTREPLLALALHANAYDMWRGMLRMTLPASLRRDVHHSATAHHPLLDLVEAATCLRVLGSRATLNRHATFMRSLASVTTYAALRGQHAAAPSEEVAGLLTAERKAWLAVHQLPPGAVQAEIQFNLGRWYHTVNLLPAAMEHYLQAMRSSAGCTLFTSHLRQMGYRHPADVGIDAACSLLVLLQHHTPTGQWALPPGDDALLHQQLMVAPLLSQPEAAPPPPRRRGVLDRLRAT